MTREQQIFWWNVNSERLYRLTCRQGHAREFGQKCCRRCQVQFVARTMARYPDKYGPMKRAQKRKERARRKEAFIATALEARDRAANRSRILSAKDTARLFGWAGFRTITRGM
jgi:hypothetical protein